MRNDQIFVLLLVILLPMSGCFNGAVGDAEAEEGTEENTLQEVTAVNKIITIHNWKHSKYRRYFNFF